MAPTRACNRAGIWAVAIAAMLMCSQMATVASDPNGGASDQCSNNICNNKTNPSSNFVLVHGMGGGAWFWFEAITMLENMGHTVTAVDLTSNGISKVVADDVATLAQYAKPLIDAIAAAPGPVILVGHSLGGGVIAYASEISSTKVSKAVYLSAVTPSYGQSMFSAFPADTFPNLINGGFLSFNGSPNPTSATLTVNNLDQYYMSQTPAQYINLAEVAMTDTPFRPGVERLPLTPANFGKVRRFYIRTGADKTVSPADQDAMIAANPPEKVFCIPRGDHAVFFSAPTLLTGLLDCISAL